MGKIEKNRCVSPENTTQKELFVYATFKTDSDGKRKLTDISITQESLRKLIDQAFIKSGRKSN